MGFYLLYESCHRVFRAGFARTQFKSIGRSYMLQQFLHDESDDRLVFVPEHTATAKFCSFTGPPNVRPQDITLHLCCDMEMTDLTAYEVEEKAAFSLVECIVPSEDFCRSVSHST